VNTVTEGGQTPLHLAALSSTCRQTIGNHIFPFINRFYHSATECQKSQIWTLCYLVPVRYFAPTSFTILQRNNKSLDYVSPCKIFCCCRLEIHIETIVVDPDPDWIRIQWGPWIYISGSRKAKMTHKNRKSFKFPFLKCWMFSFEG
jgi:hypothetical protein